MLRVFNLRPVLSPEPCADFSDPAASSPSNCTIERSEAGQCNRRRRHLLGAPNIAIAIALNLP
jgi:hypothetical protein